MPRKLWVVIGPFIGWKVVCPGNGGITNGPGILIAVASGLPKSQAKLSKSPKIWQLAQAESPWLDVLAASYRNGRPRTMLAGSGLNIAVWAISRRVVRSITEIELSN